MSRAGETTISLRDIEIWTRIGISDEERAAEQRVLVTVTMECEGRAGMTDRPEDTTDYEAVSNDIRGAAKSGRKTLEKLAENVAEAVLRRKTVRSVTVELKKFVLPGTKHAALTITRISHHTVVPL